MQRTNWQSRSNRFVVIHSDCNVIIGNGDTTVKRRQSSGNSHILDKLDYQIINLMTLCFDNKDISDVLNRSLTTIRRRVRFLLISGCVSKISLSQMQVENNI